LRYQSTVETTYDQPGADYPGRRMRRFVGGRKVLGFSRGYLPLIASRELVYTARTVWESGYPYTSGLLLTVYCHGADFPARVTSVERLKIKDLTDDDLEALTPDCATREALVCVLNNALPAHTTRIITEHDEVDFIGFEYQDE
jgi:hypothetical protein